MKNLLAVALFLAVSLPLSAACFDAFPQSNQPSDKLVGMTVIADCPSEAAFAAIDAETLRLGADFAQIVQPIGQSFCPTTLFGPPAQFIDVHDLPAGSFTVQVGGRVTIGLQWRRQRP